MGFFAPPAKAEISATPSPSNAVAKAGLGKLWDSFTGLLGTTGQPAEALAAMKLLDPHFLTNIAPTFAVAANALTITMKDKDGNNFSADNPAFVACRHATLGNGGHNLRKVVANFAMTISSGSTLGHTSGFLKAIYIYVIDNAGALELAVAGTFQGEQGIVSTTAEGGVGAADNPDVMYSTTARANVPFRLVAIAWCTQAAAGTWINLPTETKAPPFHLERVGEIVEHAGGDIEYGFYGCDGANTSRSGGNAKLFGKIGTTWGVGDGATTMGLPDSRRRTAVGNGGSGTGTLGNAVGNVGGEEGHVQTLGEMFGHSHTQQGAPFTGAGTFIPSTGTTSGPSPTGTNTTTVGGGGAMNVMQPSYVVNKKIRWLGDI